VARVTSELSEEHTLEAFLADRHVIVVVWNIIKGKLALVIALGGLTVMGDGVLDFNDGARNRRFAGMRTVPRTVPEAA
jgi:hypothetical protein